jgi:LysM repeat protein
MNNQNPLVPQGSAMEQKNKGRARVKIAVFFVLAVHGIGLMALLMQGCGQSKEPLPSPEMTESNLPPAFVEPAPAPTTTSTPPVVATAPVVPEMSAPPPVALADATEYSIVKGDYLEKIAKNFHVSVKAIMEANPGIEPTKLKIGQKIRIPAPAAPAASVVPGVATAENASAGGEQIYTVKSGDTLIGIARQFGTTQKAISAANNLKTTSIKVGQKLRIPLKASAPAVAPVAPVEPVPTTPSAPPPTAPPGA